MFSFFRLDFQGLKTGQYYLRSKPAVDPVKFALQKKQAAGQPTPSEPTPSEPTPASEPKPTQADSEENEDDENGGCEMCSA